MFAAVVGHSEDLEADSAASDVLTQCRAGLGGVGRGLSADVTAACRSGVESAKARTAKPARLCTSPQLGDPTGTKYHNDSLVSLLLAG